ncbi:MAG: DNA adenine methylase [Legionellales bacterium]|nr:DNA adenine methylase [Legionellales bacterium]|tara:strand:- start:152 stop:964 length:813 start_codon:yes stop_codon:yes gene_type:complete
MTKSYHRSFLKWAGGKYRLLPYILPHLPVGKRLIEPFLGSGVIFLNTDYPSYKLNDTNKDLINLYKILKTEKSDFINHAAKYFDQKYNHPDAYYLLRNQFNTSKDIYERALLFLYLNRHGYNGLCRYNKQGKYNVPFGHYTKPYFPADEMAYFYHKAKKATFTCTNFTTSIKKGRQGDIIYCDPPYVPLSKTAHFTHYYQHGFSMKQQEELATMAKNLQQEKVKILISNHHTPLTEKLYAPAKIFAFEVQRNISCKGYKRTKVRELLAQF